MPSRDTGSPPPGLEELRSGRARTWVRDEARAWVENALARYETLYDAARALSGGRAGLEGRAPVHLVDADDGAWAVRHYMRGGAVASYLGDRYLRVGAPRPFREAHASDLLRSAGVPTPPVLAAAVYPAGLYYRADLVTAFVADAPDLGEVLFGEGRELDPVARVDALGRAGALIAELARLGVRHPDLNVKNLLVEAAGSGPRLHLIDLDGCRWRSKGDRTGLATAMEDRLLRSIRKWERRTGRHLSEEERSALHRGVLSG